MKRKGKFSKSGAGVKKKFKAGNGVDRNKLADEATIAWIESSLDRVYKSRDVFFSRDSKTGTIPEPLRHYYPRNIITQKNYHGINTALLRHATWLLKERLPLFASFKQFTEADISIQSGSKAACYIKIFHFDEKTETKDERMYVTWMPVFHISQTVQTPLLKQRIEDYEREHTLSE